MQSTGSLLANNARPAFAGCEGQGRSEYVVKKIDADLLNCHMVLNDDLTVDPECFTKFAAPPLANDGVYDGYRSYFECDRSIP